MKLETQLTIAKTVAWLLCAMCLFWIGFAVWLVNKYTEGQ
jgi:hypothetical protein